MASFDLQPRFLYGTAWKEDETERLVGLALAAGFRGIDTANQRKHYNEAAVGAALQRAYDAGVVERDQLFLQTKFTSVDGQDHRLPYDANATPHDQVRQSFASSLQHLHTDHVDSYVLHGPTTRTGLAPYDLAVWRAMEALHAEGRTRFLGVSNVSLEQLEALCAKAEVLPRFVQNRCYAKKGWDRQVRAFCCQHDLVYQGFSLLTANRTELDTGPFKALVARVKRTPAQVVFDYALAVGMLPLTGTSRASHMREDLERATLSADDLRLIEAIGGAE